MTAPLASPDPRVPVDTWNPGPSLQAPGVQEIPASQAEMTSFQPTSSPSIESLRTSCLSEPNFPAGQTVDDLLMSILGVLPNNTAQSPPQPGPQTTARAQPLSVSTPPPMPSASLPPAGTAPPVPPHPPTNLNMVQPPVPRPKPSKVRDATFAQAAAAASTMNPLDLSTSSSSTNWPQSSNGLSSPFVSDPSFTIQPVLDSLGGPVSAAPKSWIVNGNGSSSPRTAMGLATADAMASRTNGRHFTGLGRGNEKVRKKEFVQNLLELVHVSAGGMSDFRRTDNVVDRSELCG